MKLFDTEELVTESMYVPESEPFSINFQNAGYESSLALVNASSFLFNFTLHFSLVLGFLVLPLLVKCRPKMRGHAKTLSNYLFWNGTIRIYIEAYLDLMMPAMLNIS